MMNGNESEEDNNRMVQGSSNVTPVDSGDVAASESNGDSVLEVLDRVASSPAPRPTIPQHQSTPSRITGWATSPDTESRQTPGTPRAVDGQLYETLIGGSSTMKSLKQENEELQKRACAQRSGIPVYAENHYINKFDPGRYLGRGTFGEVSECVHFLTSKSYAVKRISIEEAFTKEGEVTPKLATAMQEVTNLAELSHSSIVQFFECWLERKSDFPRKANLYIQMELCKTSLYTVINGGNDSRCVGTDGNFSVVRELGLFENLAAGLAYLHSKGFIHSDLKPENCLITFSGKLVLADFGVARRQVESFDNLFAGVLHEVFERAGTPLYYSPEQEQRLTCGTASDAFTAGLIFVEIFDLDFKDIDDLWDLHDAFREGQFPLDILSDMRKALPGTLDFVMNMVSSDPEHRPSASEMHEIVKHMQEQQRVCDTLVTIVLVEGEDLGKVAMHVLLSLRRAFGPTLPEFKFKGSEISVQFDPSVEQDAIIAFAKRHGEQETVSYVRHNCVMYDGSG